ncbi:MAG: HAMP domain-containing protein [Betaproteobacteria bacterium]|nr:HAMP domain-containing protein [Betaproteobacteria bacterium]
MFAQDLPVLLGITLVLVLVLMGLVGYQLLILRRRLRAGLFGSKLALRLVLLFALVAVLPGALVYSVSVQFLNRSIESWFDVRVDKALESGLRLGRTVLENLLQELTQKAHNAANALERVYTTRHASVINELREQTGVQEVALFRSDGTLIVFSGSESSGLMPVMPKADSLRQVRMMKTFRAIESDSGTGYLLRVVVPVDRPGDEIHALQLVQAVPKVLARDAEQVKAMYRDYQELELSRTGLKRLYGISLTLTLLLALSSALLLAILFSERLAAPLRALAAGTRAVAQGDFTLRHPVQRHDELGVLTESFNTMTHQLSEAQSEVMQNQEALHAAKTYLESIVDKLSAGVLSLDSECQLRSFNPSAALILGADLGALIGRPLSHWGRHDEKLAQVATEVSPLLDRPTAASWEAQFEFKAEGGAKILLVRGSSLQPGGGYIVVFDDITRVLQAQRYAAWGEVARRFAHEIKNPLTPIQLSAERLEHRLVEKLAGEDADMVRRSTRTIVNQVTALKGMVDAFSHYARAPEIKLQALDLNFLVQEILSLYEANRPIIEPRLGAGLQAVMGDPAQLRQVIHNLLQNAQQAVGEQSDARIELRTEAMPAGARICVSDNGPGFPAELLGRLFEPYVTTKTKGTGLGLAIVKRIVEEHNGQIELQNLPVRGALVRVTIPWAQAPARVAEIKARAG